ncbi:MAG: 2-amino-3,7-dideoxy-D-threo-hept-6-ulosonate synthase [Bacillota bacterium]
MVSGKEIRMKRIFNKGRTLISALDYGGFMGPVAGLENPSKIIRTVIEAGADAILVNPGVAKREWITFAGRVGLIIRITGGCTRFSPDGEYHTIVLSVEEAVRLGADAVAVMVIVGSKEEHKMFENMGKVIQEADHLGIPVLAELLPSDASGRPSKDIISLCARVGYELGADVIKTYYPGNGFSEIVNSCPIPIVIAGGLKTEDSLSIVKEAIEAGAKGVAFGRNIFQAENPGKIVAQIKKILYE